MRLRTHGLAVEIEVTSRICDSDAPAPYDSWLECTVHIQVPAFSGSIHWNAMGVDFARFREELVRLYENVGTPRSATLAGLEPGVKLSLAMMEGGQVAGEYEFTDFGGHGADAPILAGTFGLDQSFLPDLIREVDGILSTIATGGLAKG